MVDASRAEDRVVVAHDHPARVVGLLQVGRVVRCQSKLVGGWEVGVRACDQAVVVDDDQLLCGPLRERGDREAVVVSVKRVHDAVVVQDAVLDEDIIRVLDGDVDDADALAAGPAVTLDDGDLIRRVGQCRRVGDRVDAHLHLELVETEEGLEDGRRAFGRAGDAVDARAWLATIGERRAGVALDEGGGRAVGHRHEPLVAARRAVAHVVGGIDDVVCGDVALVGLERLDRAELAVERAVRVDVRRAHEVGEHHAGRRVDGEERGHQLLAHDRVVGRVDRHALEVEVAAGEHAQRLPVVPRRVGRRVRHLDVCPVLPRDEAVRVVDQRDAERLGLRVRVKGRASVAEGEWLLDAHFVDVQRVIPRVGRAAVPVVSRAPELAINAVSISVEHRLDV
eukprot:scaffold65448_cov64-Phaeocystis_antarctica.AAC.6